MIAQQRFSLMPTVVKNLLIINGLFFMGMKSIQYTFGIDITNWLGLHYPTSDRFIPSQLITHMFMHGSLGHIASNMIMLWFLGSAMENYWGSKKFLIYYMLTGLGASAFYITVKSLQYHYGLIYLTELDFQMVGASGAVFGVLLAFGMTFPNQLIYIYFFLPIKAKYIVIGYGLLELYNGLSTSDSGIAHFAHLGGMLFGFLLIRRWRKTRYL